MNLGDDINRLGAKLTLCSKDCAGIARDTKKGILPRCLYFEAGDEQSPGAVVVGINPAPAGRAERRFYTAAEPSYDRVVDYWERELRDRNPYYVRLRHFMRQLDLKGPILWTELVKCERDARSKHDPPPQTFRQCAQTYLQQEIAAVPEEWPLVAVGRIAYGALTYMFPSRALIGAPHPTGSFGDFRHLFDGRKNLLPTYKEWAQHCYEDGRRDALWLKVPPKRHARSR